MGIGAAGTTVVGVAAGSDSRHTVTFWLRGGENTSTGVHARYCQGTLAGCPTPESVIALATVGISNPYFWYTLVFIAITRTLEMVAFPQLSSMRPASV
jgi:hypothetical protein